MFRKRPIDFKWTYLVALELKLIFVAFKKWNSKDIGQGLVSLPQTLGIFFSEMYVLLSEIEAQKDTLGQRWERDTQMRIQERKWQESNQFIVSVSTKVAIRENFYKVRNQWHLMLYRINKMLITADKKCWRCKQAVETDIHVWWSCAKIAKYWKMIHEDYLYFKSSLRIFL